VKRSRKVDDGAARHDAIENDIDHASSTLPPLLPAINSHSPPSAPEHDQIGSSSRLNATHPSTTGGQHAAGVSSPRTRSSSNPQRNNANSFPSSAPGFEPLPRYVSAFEDFANRNRDRVAAALEAYGQQAVITDEDIDRALARRWDELDPSTKREYGDRCEKKDGI
jgi:hypothetical protein